MTDPFETPQTLSASTAAHRRGVWPLVTAAEMQSLDRLSIDEDGVPGEVLMESAGRALVAPLLALRRTSARQEAPIRIFCGAGNNGGDGFVLLRHLLAEGIAAEVLLLGDPARLPVDAAKNWARLDRVSFARRVVATTAESPDWESLLGETSVGVDALFGTGLKRPIGGAFGTLIREINRAQSQGLPVLSVDMPSGISAETGEVLGCAIQANATVTISLPKIGLALYPGVGHAGEITVARVGIRDPDPERWPRAELWSAEAAWARFPRRDLHGHKGSFGHVLVVAGSAGKTGAAALCSRAAARSGAGLVTLAYPVGLESELSALPAEVMSAPVAATDEGSFARAGEKATLELVSSRDVVALGPGIGTTTETVGLVRDLVRSIDRPLVIDADGLNALQGELARLHDRSASTILTPHPGEAARLLDSTAAEVNADRIGAARALSDRAQSIVVLKGARTVIADPEGRALVTPTGGPILASGGTGDVLTGVVAALLAAGLTPFEAAGLGAWWHGATADRMLRSRVGFGLLASELADALPDTVVEVFSAGDPRHSRGTSGHVPQADPHAETEDEEWHIDGGLDLHFPGR